MVPCVITLSASGLWHLSKKVECLVPLPFLGPGTRRFSVRNCHGQTSQHTHTEGKASIAVPETTATKKNIVIALCELFSPDVLSHSVVEFMGPEGTMASILLTTV